ncbi:MAG: hypothetical protein M1818_006347 [Claussenomyces sp. TS43310]|nr:MAG: hypothetical protein M1818_006347 [Claussenomyces sp. TS43310]
MSSSKPIMLLLGSGSNIGQAVAKRFEAEGYRVAIAARSVEECHESTNRWSYRIDLNKPNTVADLFVKVSEDIGIPSVVIYNGKIVASAPHTKVHTLMLLSITTAYSLVLPRGSHPFSISVKDFEASLNVNAVSVYAAAKHAVDGFDKLPKSMLKSFIFTGNILNTSPIPRLWTIGAGKSASAHVIESAARAYAEKEYHFYYVDERKEDGSPIGDAISGQAHAEYFVELAGKTEQGPWLSTFVKDKGYVKFH